MHSIFDGRGVWFALSGALLLAGCGGGGGGSAFDSGAGDGGGSPTAQGAPWTWAKIVAAEPGSVRVMPLGDSITVGFGATAGYRFPLQVALQTAGVDSIDFVGSSTVNSPVFLPDPEHEGHGGWTLADLVFHDGQGLEPDSSIEQILTLHAPEVLLLHAGTNDMFEGGTWQESLPRLRDLLERIHAFDPEITTVVAAIIPTADPSVNLLVRWYNARLAELLAELSGAGQRLVLADMQTACPTFVSGDGTDVHPDFNCYVKMANEWAAGLVALGEAMPQPPVLQPVVTGVTATASGFFGAYQPDLAVDGSGLGAGMYEGLHEFDELSESAWRSDLFDIESDLSNDSVPSSVVAPYIQLALPQPTDVSLLEFWNGRQVTTGNDTWVNKDGILRVEAFTSVNGVDWVNRGLIPLTQGPGRQWAAGQEVSVDWHDVSFVRFEVTALQVIPPPPGEKAKAQVALSEVRLRGLPTGS
ncbi:GDSL-type esterase/lipase family protein [Engelhardtia mirabilis]